MRNRAISPVATILSVLLLVCAATAAQAGPVAYSDVVHVMGNVRNGGQSQELRLRSISQDGSTTLVNSTVSSSGKSSSTDTSSGPISLISTTPGLQEGQQGNVEVIEEGEVTGTVCDCGEIFIPGGGFPAWIALGGVPLVCVLVDCTPDRKEECEGPNCNPCVGPQCNPCVGPQCNPPEIPEPATIFLLGSGLAALGAKARRRYTQSRTDNADTTKV
jgi:hypothetical protein